MRRLCLFALLLGCAPPVDSPLPAERTFADGPAWIAFTDRGGVAQLPPAAAERRARSGLAEAPFDRPVHAPYVAALQDLGLEIRHRSRVLNAVSVQSTAGVEAELAALPFVHAVRPVGQHRPSTPTFGPAPTRPRDDPPPSPVNYGAGDVAAIQVAADAMHGLGYFGAGVTIGVADTGFQFDHEALVPAASRVLAARDFLQADDDVGQGPGDAVEQARHGTLVLGVLTGDAPGALVGIAPEANLLLAKTEQVDVEVPAEEDVWVAGVEWLEAQGADLVTSSLGYDDWYDDEEFDGRTAVTTVFAQALATQAGLPILVSVGNRGPGPTTLVAPADAEAVLAIGATTQAGTVASFSSRGPSSDGRTKPDLAAFGDDVPVPVWDAPTGLETASGTSLATPIVAGIAALLMEAHPDWGRTELTEALTSTASQSFLPDQALGFGIPDAFAACGLICSCRDADGDGFLAADCGGDDCDDVRAAVFPGATEVCDGLDSDCDGSLPGDEADADGDGDPLCLSDCDDDDPTRQGLDFDNDGFSLCDGDCADGDAARNPGVVEIPYDGVDQDCSGADLTDVDGDGFDAADDCDDRDPSVFPDPISPLGAIPDPLPPTGGHELCSDNRDNDCDGAVDESDPDCEEPLVNTIGDATADGAGCAHVPGSSALALLLLLTRRRRCAA